MYNGFGGAHEDVLGYENPGLLGSSVFWGQELRFNAVNLHRGLMVGVTDLQKAVVRLCPP